MVALLLGLGIVGYRHFFPSAERQIWKRVKELERVASFKAGSGNLALLSAVSHLRDLLAHDVLLDLTAVAGVGESWQGREEIVQMAIAARTRARRLQVHFVDPQILVGQDRRSGSVRLAVLVDFNEEKNAIAQILQLDYVKTESGWVAARIKAFEVLGGDRP